MVNSALTAGLYLVATPIGAARDITLRALDILGSADVLAAEDTRNLRKLMDIHGISLGDRPLVAYHDHNGARMQPRLTAHVKDGKSVAYMSDAGTPLVADPGYGLARAMIAADLPVFAAPGASAILTALCVAGLPSDRFMFAGFAPPKSAARKTMFRQLAPIQTTLIFYESPKRLAATLADMTEVFGAGRPAAICRELTKKFEQCMRGNLADLAARLDDEMTLKGEIVLVLGPPADTEISDDMIDAALTDALASLSVRDASSEVAEALSVPRKRVYARALVINA